MAYTTAQIATGTEYYDVAADAVKQDAQSWEIRAVAGKVFTFDTSNPGSFDWKTLPNVGYWRRIGLPAAVAAAVAWALNHPSE